MSSPIQTVKEPIGIVVDPTGTHVYVASMSDNNNVGAYNLSSSGGLTPISGSPFSTGGSTPGVGFSIAMNSAGTFLYVLDLSQIYVYSVDPTTGALTLRQTLAGPRNGNELALDPGGSYLYAVGAGANSILTYSIDTSSGQLTQTKSSAMAEQNGAYTISLSPTGQFAYTIENNNYLVSYAISNGTFAPVGKIYSGVYGAKIAVDPSGSFVYVPQACSNCASGTYNVIHEFSIGAKWRTDAAVCPIRCGGCYAVGHDNYDAIRANPMLPEQIQVRGRVQAVSRFASNQTAE
jgi:DNA-binding beta-propeller fold protein YncE